MDRVPTGAPRVERVASGAGRAGTACLRDEAPEATMPEEAHSGIAPLPLDRPGRLSWADRRDSRPDRTLGASRGDPCPGRDPAADPAESPGRPVLCRVGERSRTPRGVGESRRAHPPDETPFTTG